ncbi:hypothetical protein [Pontibacillus litoralis]|uniref:Uncharacterized protein n=1 Tax=Pontibacillus litoralis JSM 072002 TaxID=1385512 RepID=A0A0A5G162_9BACI|nr:hypothetical protein [Pontibacillus litoralis]KGX84843.1 hypothetical protein N784_11745 [Pontibacillus litoralis JSM 072002]
MFNGGSLFSHLPNTIIEINPSSQRLTPQQLKHLLRFIVGDLKGIKVGQWDEKIDLEGYTSEQVAKRLYVPNQRKQPFEDKDFPETYYYGVRNGNQVKVYNKAKQMKMKDGILLTRIERTNKVNPADRLSVDEFLNSEPADVFRGMKMIDIDMIDNRKRIKKLINKENTLVDAIQKMSDSDKHKLKRERGFKNPSVDIHMMFYSDLNDWLGSLRMLHVLAINEEGLWDMRDAIKEKSHHLHAIIENIVMKRMNDTIEQSRKTIHRINEYFNSPIELIHHYSN